MSNLDLEKYIKKFTPVLNPTLKPTSSCFANYEDLAEKPELVKSKSNKVVAIARELTAEHAVSSKNQLEKISESSRNNTIREHESEDLGESSTFTKQTDNVEFFKTGQEGRLSREDKASCNQASSRKNGELCSQDEDNKSISSCSSTSSKVSAHPEKFNIKVCGEVANSQAENQVSSWTNSA